MSSITTNYHDPALPYWITREQYDSCKDWLDMARCGYEVQNSLVKVYFYNSETKLAYKLKFE